VVTAIAIKLDSKGPVFFKQKRHGFNNDEIEVYKFRSLYTHMTDHSVRKSVTKDDPRVTRVGRFIRKTSIDELPQLFNVVFKGNLSLVGPRPHAVQQKLQELAGTGATDCGRVKSQDSSVVQPASDCAMKAAEGKQAFYVAYDLPGLTTAVAGNAQGNLFSIQAQTADASSPKIESTPCPSVLRLAQSGRVTCYPAGSMGGMGTAGAASPHGGMGMPPATGANPHAGAVPSHGKPTTPK